MTVTKEQLQIVIPVEKTLGPVYEFTGYRQIPGSKDSLFSFLETYTCLHTEAGDKGDTKGLDKDGKEVILWEGGKYWVLRPIEKVYRPEGCPKVKFLDVPPIVLSDNPYIRTHKEVNIEIIAFLKIITIWETAPRDKSDIDSMTKIIKSNAAASPEELAKKLLDYMRAR